MAKRRFALLAATEHKRGEASHIKWSSRLYPNEQAMNEAYDRLVGCDYIMYVVETCESNIEGTYLILRSTPGLFTFSAGKGGLDMAQRRKAINAGLQAFGVVASNDVFDAQPEKGGE